MPEDDRDFKYDYVYYCPDIEEIKYIVEHSENVFLPNCVDAREFFNNCYIPKKMWPASVGDYSKNIDNAITLLNCFIDGILQLSDVRSWKDVNNYLNTIMENNTYQHELVKKIRE